MTVQTGGNSIDYTGDGIQTVFNFAFRVDDVNWLSVDFLDDFDTFALNVDQEATPGGTATYLVAPPNLQFFTILRSTPQSQLLDYARYDPFDSGSHEDALDRLTMMIQDLTGDVVAIQALPIGTIEGQLLRWNNTTKLYEVALTTFLALNGRLQLQGSDNDILHLQDNVENGASSLVSMRFLDAGSVVQGEIGFVDGATQDMIIQAVLGGVDITLQTGSLLRASDTLGVLRVVGYNIMAPKLEDGAYTFDLDGNGTMVLNEDADAETWTIDQDATVADGGLYGMSNEGAGDVTLLVGTGVTAIHISAAGVRTTKTATQSWTLQTGFLGSLWKRSPTEFWWWGTTNFTP